MLICKHSMVSKKNFCLYDLIVKYKPIHIPTWFVQSNYSVLTDSFPVGYAVFLNLNCTF